MWKTNGTVYDKNAVRLQWRTHALLNCFNANLSGVTGLSSNNSRLLEQHGALSVNTLNDETKITVTKLIQQLRTEKKPINTFYSAVPRYRKSSLVFDKNTKTALLTKIECESLKMYLLEYIGNERLHHQLFYQHQEQLQEQLIVIYLPKTFIKALLKPTKISSIILTEEQRSTLQEALKIFNQNTTLLDDVLTQKLTWPKLYAYTLLSELIDNIPINTLPKTHYSLIKTTQGYKIELQKNILQYERKKALNEALGFCIDASDIDISDNGLIDEDIETILTVLSKQTRNSAINVLRLSNNKITDTGLKILLNWGKGPKQLLLDGNYIYRLPSVIKELEKDIKNPQLQNIDISGNYLPRWMYPQVNETRGTTVEVSQKNTLPSDDGYNYPKTFFQASSFYTSQLLIKKSLLSNYDIDEDNCVIALYACKNESSSRESNSFFDINISRMFGGEHAFLVMEGLHKFGQRYLLMADLYSPDGKKINIQLCYVSPSDIKKRTQDFTGVFQKTAKITKEQSKKLREVMLNFRNTQGLSTYATFPKENSNQYNCLTWILTMLYKSEIIDSPKENSWIPSWHVGNNSGCLLM
ncbi:MAG: hypothetical protein LEGION0398_MBIBDBAK_00764 [Legionellaceae bacterium]